MNQKTLVIKSTTRATGPTKMNPKECDAETVVFYQPLKYKLISICPLAAHVVFICLFLGNHPSPHVNHSNAGEETRRRVRCVLWGGSANTLMSWEVASSQHLVSFSSEQLSYLVELKLSCLRLINLDARHAARGEACAAASRVVSGSECRKQTDRRGLL